MAAVQPMNLIPDTYTNNIIQNDLLGMVYLPIDFHTFMKCHNNAMNIFNGDEGGFIVPPFFEDRPGSKAIGAHVSIISVSEARKHKILLGKEDCREVTLRFFESTIVKPENWKGVSEIITLRVECDEFEQLREKYGLPPNKFPFSLTLAVKHTISSPRQIKAIAPVLEAPKYSDKLLEIMKGMYTGTLRSHHTSRFIYIDIDDAFYDCWRKIPETKGYDIPYFWTFSGVGLHSTVVSAAETRNNRISLNSLYSQTVEFTVTGFKEVDTRSWDNVTKAIQLTIDCPHITKFRQVYNFPARFEPHITIGVIFSDWKPECIEPISCHDERDTGTLTYFQSRI
jgi:hypothetical protein